MVLNDFGLIAFCNLRFSLDNAYSVISVLPNVLGQTRSALARNVRLGAHSVTVQIVVCGAWFGSVLVLKLERFICRGLVSFRADGFLLLRADRFIGLMVSSESVSMIRIQ
jgi:hypothetical protein